MKFLLDTNICIYIINKRPPGVLAHFEAQASGDIAVSSLVVAELAFGVERSGSQRNREALAYFLSPFEVLPFGQEAVWQYARLRENLRGLGRPIGPIDTLIAAQALSLDLTLVTNNTSEFLRVPGLRIENWAHTPQNRADTAD